MTSIPILDKVSAVVIDGITIGHPCCGRHNCHNPLPNQRARFCRDHEGDNKVCCITTCTALATSGSKVCGNPEHIAIQRVYQDRGQARFQLQRLLNEARAAATIADPTSEARLVDVGEEEFELDAEGQVILNDVEVGNYINDILRVTLGIAMCTTYTN